jgi:hypothetical protein
MTWGQLFMDVFDKLLIGLVVAGVTWLINWNLERHKTRLTYRQKLAESTIAAYREIGSILHEQAFQIQDFIEAVGRFLKDPTNATNDDAATAWSRLARSYRLDQPKVLQNSMFVSKDVADRLFSHQRLVKDFTKKANPLRDENVKDVTEFTNKMSLSLAQLQSKMMDEIRNPPVFESKK